jgi:hypothetical protein
MDARGFRPATEWRKSSISGQQGSCVEVAWDAAGNVGVRDTKDRSGPVLVFRPDEWTAFLDGVRKNEFDQR